MEEISQQELENFKEIVQRYVEAFVAKKKLQEQTKPLNTLLKELSPLIQDFMAAHKIDDLNTKIGRLSFTKSKRKSPLNKKTIHSKLNELLNNESQSEEFTNHIMNRTVEEVPRLKMTLMKSAGLNI